MEVLLSQLDWRTLTASAKDIALMKQAGFTMVRVGDFSCDAFEPSEAKFDFAWFDQTVL